MNSSIFVWKNASRDTCAPSYHRTCYYYGELVQTHFLLELENPLNIYQENVFHQKNENYTKIFSTTYEICNFDSIVSNADRIRAHVRKLAPIQRSID